MRRSRLRLSTGIARTSAVGEHNWSSSIRSPTVTTLGGLFSVSHFSNFSGLMSPPLAPAPLPAPGGSERHFSPYLAFWRSDSLCHYLQIDRPRRKASDRHFPRMAFCPGAVGGLLTHDSLLAGHPPPPVRVLYGLDSAVL